jgi:hypothetical protein
MAVAPSGRSVSDKRWETLVADAQAAFLRTCALKHAEPSAHAPNEELISVCQKLEFVGCLYSYLFRNYCRCSCTIQALSLLAPQLLPSIGAEQTDFNSLLSTSALQLDTSLCRLSQYFEAMETFLDEVSMMCGAAWDHASSSTTLPRDEAAARASAWSSISVRMSQQQAALDCMRLIVAAMLDGSCDVSASQAAFSEVVALQRLQATGE